MFNQLKEKLGLPNASIPTLLSLCEIDLLVDNSATAGNVAKVVPLDTKFYYIALSASYTITADATVVNRYPGLALITRKGENSLLFIRDNTAVTAGQTKTFYHNLLWSPSPNTGALSAGGVGILMPLGLVLLDGNRSSLSVVMTAGVAGDTISTLQIQVLKMLKLEYK